MTIATNTTRATLGDALEFLRLLWAIDHALAQASRRMATTTGVTGPQRIVLQIVGRFPGIPAGQLAELLHVHPGTLTTTLARLIRKGLVCKRSDPRDGRRTLLGLTANGRALDAPERSTIELAVNAALRSAPPQKVRATREVLEAIARALQPSPSNESQTKHRA